MVLSPKTFLLLYIFSIYRNLRFFHHIPDAIFDVILFMSFNAILGWDIFGKKTFESMRLPP